MAFARFHIHRGWLPGALGLARTPLGEFGAVAVALGVGLLGLTAVMPGATLGASLAALGAYGVAASVAGRAFRRGYPHDHLGPCNAITLTRLALAMALIAPILSGTGASWAVFAVAVLALTLDGFDGWLARRQGHVSDFGARFDMEVDSVLALILALGAALGSGAGPVALLLGLPRYLFAATAWSLPWMSRDLPERFSRKVVCVIQLGALIALQAPILPQAAALALVPLVAAALVWSFAVDVVWLWRRRT